MPRDLNIVKTGPRGSTRGAAPDPPRYHHGALREALLDAAESIIRERGVDGFSLREAARRAGVSPAAPQHHFGDARGLLTAVATAGFAQLADALAAADAAAATEAAGEGTAAIRDARIRTQGRAYVEFALAESARFDVMWRRARVDGEDPAYAAAGRRAFAVLESAVTGVAFAEATAPPPAESDARAIACWALVHGFARLALDGVFGPGPAAARAAADALLPAVLECLRV